MSTTIPAGSLRPTRSSSITVNGAEVAVADRDRTRPFLLLHGGAGPATMAGFADLLAERTHSRVLVPTHPGFGGTRRPASLAATTDLAATYVALLDALDLTDVTVVGNSFGGWVAAEMALMDSPRVSGAVIVDGIGIEVDGHPVTSVAGLEPAQLAQLSFHDPAKAPRPAAVGGAGPSPDLQALIAYAGPAMSDPTLADRLGRLHLPVHVIWGESDGIVSPAYGRAYADALPLSTFTLLPRSGHLPQVESPEELLGAILDLGR
ncbi:alpha/beta fold hydrolase [Nakamurella endophytica]|uniref:Alpha/beta hydrolase n=1 Tax=Nakamurella endophytica TaxID=1748367 RepID=A0A917SQT4_9ACTN|nr:alpha/beta hydrolase [Nakamurella endophytica]GGL91674.1 alpha/beta hydrolase [Nakamurella endophytica]